MKTFYSFLAAVCILCFTSCAASDNNVEETQSLLESVMSKYGAEEVSLNATNLSNIPSVLTEDMRNVLETLRLNSNEQYNCVRLSEDKYEKVVMKGVYQTVTRGVTSPFSLNVELKFSFTEGKVYYWGTDYSYSSELFDWRAQGLSLTPSKEKDGFTYFESESYLYFKLADKMNQVVKVPVVFEGDYNFVTESGTYKFRLLKYSK